MLTRRAVSFFFTHSLSLSLAFFWIQSIGQCEDPGWVTLEKYFVVRTSLELMHLDTWIISSDWNPRISKTHVGDILGITFTVISYQSSLLSLAFLCLPPTPFLPFLKFFRFGYS